MTTAEKLRKARKLILKGLCFQCQPGEDLAYWTGVCRALSDRANTIEREEETRVLGPAKTDF